MTALLACLWACVALANQPSNPGAIQDPALRRELLRRLKVDQDARHAMLQWMSQHAPGGVATGRLPASQQARYKKLVAQARLIDQQNTRWMNEIVERQGWPTKSLVGPDGATAAWLLVQHADADPKFQRKCLGLMTGLPNDEVSRQDIAYLTDRVLLAEGKKQIYGTQFMTVDGKLTPRPLEDEANVDQRRAEVGLSSLADYIKLLEQQPGAPSK